jgi:peptidoglycan/xylan/chitin deacetylase (PgdA/CDA1 family)
VRAGGKPRNQPAGNPATVAALPVIIRFFRAHGYRFVPV